MIRLHDGDRGAPSLGKWHGPYVPPKAGGRRREAATAAGLRDATRQAAIVAPEGIGRRTPAEIEEAYAYANRCGCHFWERWRCHVVQAEKRAPRTLV